MGMLLSTLAICITLIILAVVALSVRAAERHDAEVRHEHELSNAEVLAILTRKKV